MRHSIFFLIIFSALLSAQSRAQSPNGGKLDFVAGEETANSFRPVPGASVTVVGPEGQAYTGVTGADAHFRLNDLPPGPYTIRDVQVEGYAVHFRGYPGTSYITAGNTWVVNVPLQRLASVVGTVTGDDGKPVAGATVYLEAYTRSRDGEYKFQSVVTSTQADTEGRYTLTGNRAFGQPGYLPGDYFAVSAAFPGEETPSGYAKDFVEFRNGVSSAAHVRISRTNAPGRQ